MSDIEQRLLACAFARLPTDFYAAQAPTPLPHPYLIAFNPDLGGQLGLSAPGLRDIDTLCGNRVPAHVRPLAAVYAGHQFGVYVPQLGDGRALLLGDITDVDGRR